jgi:hypothetical protein
MKTVSGYQFDNFGVSSNYACYQVLKMKISKSLLALFFTFCLLTACASGNKMGGSSKGCGCATKKGMVGY